MKREDSDKELEANTPRADYSVQEENQDDVYSSPGGSVSPVESPVR